MEPRVFLYSSAQGRHSLYVGGLSTAEGLTLFPPQEPVSIVRFGAKNYKNYGWASEEHLPQLTSAQELMTFLTSGELGLVEFEATIGGNSSVSSHDDSECNFTFACRPMLIAAIQAFAPQSGSGALLNALLSSPETYIRCAESGQIQSFKSFDEYLAKRT